MLDLGAFEEAQAAVDAVCHAGVEQRALDDARLRVAAIEHGNLVHRAAVARQLARLLDEPLRLGGVAGRLEHAHRLAGTGLGAQVLAQAPLVVADQRVRRVEDVAEAAVVALELDHLLDAVFALEGRHVAHLRTAERIDALVIVADGEHRVAFAREHLQPAVLQLVGVLELVDQQVTKAPLVVRPQGFVVAQQLVAAQQQLGEIDDAFALALFVVGLPDLDHRARLTVADLDVLGAQAVVLRARDEPRHLLRREALLVEIHRLDDALHRRNRVLCIEDLERLRQRGRLPVHAQEAVRQPMEGADPHAAHVHRQHRADARQHFLGCLVGEGHAKHAGRRYLTGLDQPGDARRQHARLSRAGAGEDQRMARRQGHGRQLFGIQVSQQGIRAGGRRCGRRERVVRQGHRRILWSRSGSPLRRGARRDDPRLTGVAMTSALPPL